MPRTRTRPVVNDSPLPYLGLAVVGAAVLAGAFFAYQAYRPNNKSDFLSTQPAPYKDAAYFSKAFVDEMHKQPGSWYTPPGTNIKMPNNFHGRWFNTLNGSRVTLGQPADAKHTLWLVGGSAVYNAEVPDALTMPTQLQNLLNKQGNEWRVENVGVPGATTAQELQRLKILPLKEGDMVVFFDGAADAAQIMETNKMVSNIGNVMTEASRYSHAHNARFVQVLQPMMFTQQQLSDYEQQLSANGAVIPLGQQLALATGYTQLRNALPILAANSGWDYADLSELLNGPDDYYLDCCTSNERGGAMIASYLAQALFKPLPPK